MSRSITTSESIKVRITFGFTEEPGGKRHSDSIGSGKTVRRNRRTEGAREKDARVSRDQKGSPKDGGADGEMVVEVARASAIRGSGPAIFVDARLAEAFVGMPVIFGEIKVVLDERSADKGVVADTIASNPRIEEREGEKENQTQEELC